jgi:hypothetical protein
MQKFFTSYGVRKIPHSNVRNPLLLVPISKKKSDNTDYSNYFTNYTYITQENPTFLSQGKFHMLMKLLKIISPDSTIRDKDY